MQSPIIIGLNSLGGGIQVLHDFSRYEYIWLYYQWFYYLTHNVCERTEYVYSLMSQGNNFCFKKHDGSFQRIVDGHRLLSIPPVAIEIYYVCNCINF